VFNDNLIVGGFVNGALRMSGSTYGPWEFWPGTIPDDGSAPSDCPTADTLWVLSRNSDLNESLWSDNIPESVKDWPAHLGAPFENLDGSPGYNANNGDRPIIRGDHMVWWVMNDRGNRHIKFESMPLGLEVRGSAWAFDTSGDMQYTLFVRHDITNYSDTLIENGHISRFTDPDLGYLGNDVIGTDSTLSLFMTYSTENDDTANDGYGYGPSPPALGLVFFDVSHSHRTVEFDSDHDSGRFMTATWFYQGSGSGIDGEMTNAEDWLNYANARYLDGIPLREGGFWTRRHPTEPRTRYWMPGDPVTSSYWSAMNAGGDPPRTLGGSEMVGMASFGPFDLGPGETISLSTAYVWARGDDHLDSISRVRGLVRSIHANKEFFLSLRGPDRAEFIDGNPPETQQFPFWLDEPYPNPSTTSSTLRLSLPWSDAVRIEIVDVLGRIRTSERIDAGPGQVNHQIDIANLNPGAYRVRVSQRHMTASKPLIVL